MNRNFLIVLAIAVGELSTVLVPTSHAAQCSVSFNPKLTQLGASSAQLFEAKGPPVATYDRNGPSNWLIYDLDYAKGVQYGNPASRAGYFAVYRRTFYYLDGSRTVVGFSENMSHRPYQLALVKEHLPWAAKLHWERMHLIRQQPVPAILATATCGELLLMIQADCYVVDDVDPKTYKRATRDPKNVGECRFRGLFVQRRDRSTENGQVAYKPYRFKP